MMVTVKYRPSLWLAFLDLIHTQKRWMHQITDDFSITPQMAQALRVLPPADSRTMKELAGEMWCDASNVTGIIDRLEARGLVERRPSIADRRVKCVILTAAGKRLRRRIDDRFCEAPPALAALSEADRQTLFEILSRALEHAAKQRSEGPT